jgi:hypothetical protein
MIEYLCKTGGCPVVVLGEEIIRPCQDCQSPVIANVAVTLYSVSSLGEVAHVNPETRPNTSPD